MQCCSDSPLSVTGNIVGLLTFAVATGLSYLAYLQLTIGALAEVTAHLGELQRTRDQLLPLLDRNHNMDPDSAHRQAFQGVMTTLTAEMVMLSNKLNIFLTQGPPGIRRRLIWLGMRQNVAEKLEMIRNLKLDLINIQLSWLVSQTAEDSLRTLSVSAAHTAARQCSPLVIQDAQVQGVRNGGSRVLALHHSNGSINIAACIRALWTPSNAISDFRTGNPSQTNLQDPTWSNEMFWHMFDISINDFDCIAPSLMDTQHSFFQPSTYFGVACVAFSVIALTGIWRSTSTKHEVRAPESRPKPRRRIAVDSLYAADTAGANAQPESALTVLAELIAWSVRLSESLRRSAGGHVATAVLSELALVTESLCRLQAVVCRDAQAIRPGSGLGACFTASTSSLNATYQLIDSQRSADPEVSSPKLLNDALQQLRAQRSALEYLLQTLSQNELPPTPPASDEGADLLKPSDALRHPFESAQTPTGITPGLDGRGWIEPPPEYSPPSSSAAFPAVEKADAKTAYAVEPEVEVGTGDANTEALYQAATENDIDTLSALLEAGLHANDTFGDLQRTALHQAAHLNHTASLSMLLRHGADMSLEDTKGDTALHLAAWAGNVEALASLLAHGADVDHLSGRDGYSPLWCAITAFHIDVARLLLKHGARISLRSGTGLSPLHQAAVTGQSAMCELLLERGAQVDTTDDDVNTPLHYAAVSGSVTSVRVLLRGGADVQAKQAQGLTPLHWAAHKGHVEVLALLLEYGASLNARAEEGATPLHLGANRGHLAVVRSLLEHGAKTDVEDAVWDGVEGNAAEMAKDKGHGRVSKVIRDWKGSQ